MVNSMLSYSGLSQGLWGEAMAVIRLPDPKLKTLGERGIECIFVGYAEHSKAFRIPNGTEDISGSVVPEEVTEEVTEEVVQQAELELRKRKRNRTPKNFGPKFQLHLIKVIRDEVSDQHSYCFNVEDDPKTFDEAIKSQDVTFWKEAINDDMDSIIGNNTWVLADLPLGCKPLGCKWIFKRKLKVDGTIEKFKARLVIQGFKQESGIDYFDTYALMARISTIRLLIAMASIHNLIIHCMDVKTTFLNGELEEEAPNKFDETGCLTKEFLSSRFSMKDIREADLILGIRSKHESNGIEISQSHYIENVLKKFNYFDCTLVKTPMDTSEKLMPNNGILVTLENVDYQSSKRLCNMRFLEYLKLYFFEYEHVAVNSTRHGLDIATIRKPASLEFKRISLIGFRSCTSRSRYQSVSNQTTRCHKFDSYRIAQVTCRSACLMLALIHLVLAGSWEQIPILNHLITLMKQSIHKLLYESNLKKCYADEPLTVPLDGLHIDDNLQFVEEPVEIMDSEVKRLKQSRIPIVKVRWNSRRGLEFTGEREDQFRKKYMHLFTETAQSSSAAS
ncbi:zinc finger, CCHC-type containing protein [Tanacetum coccineum]|uniref:Zinc finger, CCHC-type containing protein n=1 Tax=Tanacetum coccineum TaxID=301880 RepID=A0ABQ5A0Y0_9ASTR